MINKIIDNKLLFIGIHIVIGYLATLPWFPKPFGLGVIAFCVFLVVKTKNRNEEAFLLAMYVAGAEVFIRMIKGFVFYETGKYSVILLLFLGIFLGKFKQKFAIQYLFYLLLLSLGIVFTQVPEGESIRNAIVFNLSGPVVLGIAALYFYKRPIQKEQVLSALYFMILPIFSMVTFLYFRTPDIREIVFGGGANFQTSGGFGPNQVATAIGAGIFIIVVFILLKVKFTGFLILDILFLAYFIYRGLLTFSRGGIITGFAAIIFFSFFFFLHKNGSLKVFFNYFLMGGLFLFVIWVYTSNITGGMLENRYAGKNAKGVEKKDITSGRLDIIEEQFKSFFVSPLGIGVGNGKFKRQLSQEHVTAASHNEVGRLVEEHGIIGFIILIGLMFIPMINFIFFDNLQRAFIISFYLFWFLTVNHSAMRIAFPGLIYALSLIKIKDNDYNTDIENE
ncbi:O-antigen ligase domain-containing protein [Polaribacter aestuariivivens]|uniref:O-antigen ligase domain-containing protein n=1 Tax=Polaribacter aestuariivivens TaxID=2304626 RepID=A0A5S3N870_9FLAO|nr:O-antigen ligase family protein [Polaribacter aestuariivivens]TMM31337.1 O-antigen ligase domain-containing protein [Polaribacter aestuariivivens]